jgi:mono/diheme cytochrome c family protein
MKKFIMLALLLSLLFEDAILFAQSDGEKLFKQICIACHTIGQGKLIGPDLANVHKRQSEEWIIRFIKSSQSVIKSGDPYATALYEEYKRLVMPDNNYSDNQIRAIISYIAENSPGGPGAAETGGVSTAPGRPLSEATEENIHAGEQLFVGNIRLANSGATCNSCHNVNNGRVMTGGTLAKDLTEVFTRMNEAGVKAILNNPPFPAMKQAYLDNPLTEEEVFNLAAFLQKANQETASQGGKDYGLTLFFSGFGAAAVLLILFGGVWIRSKRNSVNRKIYDRQIKST